MSRQTKVQAIVKSAMKQQSSDQGQISQQQHYSDQDFNDDQYQMIDNLSAIYNFSENDSIHYLKSANFDFDEAIKLIQKDRLKQQRQKQKDQKKKEKQQQKKLQSQVEKLSLNQKKKVSNNSQNNQKITRKSSVQLPPPISLNPRKSSLIVQQYETSHYNSQYPIIQSTQEMPQSSTLNIVVVGHVDSGKSTLVGMFLHEINFLSKKQIHKNEKQSKQMGKQSFRYAWVTDSTEQQRLRGVTIDVGVKKIQLNDRQIVFLDSPGHRDFIPNMITGAAQADYAILVVDVTHFDSTFINGGQTKQHAYIVKSLGVHKIIVAMNKMDLIDWDQEKFSVIKKKLNFYLLHIGFTEQQIVYIPVSAVNGVNITKNMSKPFVCQKIVYNKTLSNIVQSLQSPARPVNKPLRISITNFYSSQTGKLKGHCVSGKIQGGILKKDDKLVILPQNSQCIVKQILKNGQKVKRASVGDNVQILIKLIDQTYFQTIRYGNVLSSLKYSIPVTKKFVMQALALQLQVPILKGTQVIIYIGTNKTQAVITKINYIFNPSTGLILKKNPKMIKSNDCAQIQIQTKQKICIQLFSNYKVFGRVIVREKKQTLCVGTVKMIK